MDRRPVLEHPRPYHMGRGISKFPEQDFLRLIVTFLNLGNFGHETLFIFQYFLTSTWSAGHAYFRKVDFMKETNIEVLELLITVVASRPILRYVFLFVRIDWIV